MKKNSKTEIELKLKVDDVESIKKKLLALGAVLAGKKRQKDILFNSRQYDFDDTGEVLRLRLEDSDQGKTAALAYKDSPTFSRDGQKSRVEYESEVEPEPIRKILDALGFVEAAVIEKTRTDYRLGELEISVDELVFGTFIELEGAPNGIREVRRQLGLEKTEPVKEGYLRLQEEWEKTTRE